jgi:hypothetical protein
MPNPADATARPVPASKLSSAARRKKLLADKGVLPPLPAKYEETSVGIVLRVQNAEALTRDWRVNHDAAKPDSTPTLEPKRPYPPKAYFLPKAVLERVPDEPLSSIAFVPRYTLCTNVTTACD